MTNPMEANVQRGSALDIPSELNIKIDRDSATPLHTQISDPVMQHIYSGELAPGQLIEDEVSLAERLRVSRPTVRRALQDLVSAGLLTRRRGVGTRVTPAHIHRQIGLTSLYDDLSSAGLQPRTDVLSYEVRLTDAKLASEMECTEGAEVVVIERLRWSGENPLALMHNVLPAHAAPSLTELTRHGLYECLARRDIRPLRAVQSVGAKIANPREAEYMKLEEGSPLVTATRHAYTESGEIIDYGRHVYDAAQYQVTFPLVA